MAGTIYLSKSCFTLDCWEEIGLVQGGTPKIGFPQSSSLPKNDFVVKFRNTPLNGISFDSLLYDKFKYLRYGSASRDLGIALERLLFERSNRSNPFKDSKDFGISPWNEFFDKLRPLRIWKKPMILGIFLVILLQDKSMNIIASRFLMFGDKDPPK